MDGGRVKRGRCLEGCGACCDPVAWVVPPGLVETLTDGRVADDAMWRDVLWARGHFTYVPRREGLARASYLSDGVMVLGNEHVALDVVTYFYECDAFDREARTCTAYGDRPPMCSGYPWYDDAPDPTKSVPEVCGYLPDVGRVPVTITPRPKR